MNDLSDILEEFVCSEVVVIDKDGNKSACEGKIVCYNNGDAEFQTRDCFNCSLVENARMTGKTKEGMAFEIRGVWCVDKFERHEVGNPVKYEARFSFEKAILTADDTLLPEFEDHVIVNLNTTGKREVRFTCGGKKCLLVFDHLRGIATLRADEQLGISSDILMLLSLAQRNVFFSPIRKTYNGTTLSKISIFPNKGLRSAHPMISRDAEKLAKFIENAWPYYTKNQEEYNLPRLFQFYCLSIADEIVEVKFILASVFMEAFKFYWALNVGKKIRFPESGLIRGFRRSKGEGKYSFKDLLEEACTDVGCKKTETGFIDNRNALFHSGAFKYEQMNSSESKKQIVPELFTLYRQIDEILLRLIGYAGPIYEYGKPDEPVIFPFGGAGGAEGEEPKGSEGVRAQEL
ncbi:MAG TPA: hypothetical protein PKH10_02705 [bacterium]|nr:hypothetical protein [bacterium]